MEKVFKKKNKTLKGKKNSWYHQVFTRFSKWHEWMMKSTGKNRTDQFKFEVDGMKERFDICFVDCLPMNVLTQWHIHNQYSCGQPKAIYPSALQPQFMTVSLAVTSERWSKYKMTSRIIGLWHWILRKYLLSLEDHIARQLSISRLLFFLVWIYSKDWAHLYISSPRTCLPAAHARNLRF